MASQENDKLNNIALDQVASLTAIEAGGSKDFPAFSLFKSETVNF